MKRNASGAHVWSSPEMPGPVDMRGDSMFPKLVLAEVLYAARHFEPSSWGIFLYCMNPAERSPLPYQISLRLI